jgi:hypothetical protein
MTRRLITRIAAIVIAAAVLFGLEQGLGLQFYFAFPAALLAYFATLVAVGLMLGVETQAK